MSKSAVPSRASISSRREKTSTATISKPKCPPKEFQIPALSVPPKPPPLAAMRENIKRKVMRRNAPEGEDLRKIKEVIRSLRGQTTSVQEFAALIAPYTGDNGAALHRVMQSELATFRRMANHIYDTMSQDISDVLANEQKQMLDFYNEKYVDYTERMMRAIDNIFHYCPDFDFEEYYRNKSGYLKSMFPTQEMQTVEMDPEEEALQKRQVAYHRLQWLRTEGERLQEENAKLQERLKQLKRQQRDELFLAEQQERAAEQQRQELETTQTDLQQQLTTLSDSMEKTMIKCEQKEMAPSTSGTRMTKGRSSRAATSSIKLKKNWSVRTAQELEGKSMAGTEMAEVSIAQGKQRRTRFRNPVRETSPFHYSPPRSPMVAPQQTSPFHYSPPRTPPEMAARGPPLHQPQSNVENAFPQRPVRGHAPKDTWRGFN